MPRKKDRRRGEGSPWISGGFTLLAAIIGGYFMLYANNTAPDDPAETVEQLLAASPIGLTAWQTMATTRYHSEEDRARVFKDYIGKQVTWEGYFEQCNRSLYDRTPVNTFCLIMYDSQMTYDEAAAAQAARDRLPPSCVRCAFPETAADTLASLRPRQRIVVRGTIATPELAGHVLCTDLSQCELLLPDGVRLARDAADSSATR